MDNGDIELGFGELRSHMTNLIDDINLDKERAFLSEKIDEVSNDIKIIKSSSITENNLQDLGRSISVLLTESIQSGAFKSANALGEIEACICNLLEEKFNMQAQKSEKIEKIIYGLVPRITCEIDECKRDDVSEFLIKQLGSDKTVFLTNDNKSDIRKLVNDHFVEKGCGKYRIPTGRYKDEEFFKNNRNSIYTAFAALSNKFPSITKTKLSEIIFQALPNAFNTEKTIQNGLSIWDNNKVVKSFK